MSCSSHSTGQQAQETVCLCTRIRLHTHINIVYRIRVQTITLHRAMGSTTAPLIDEIAKLQVRTMPRRRFS